MRAKDILGIGIFINLISSLTFADQTVYECKTEKYLVKVSKVYAGIYKYQAWYVPKASTDKPDIEISQKDAYTTEGTGPCFTRYYNFKKGNDQYSISNNVNCIKDKPPASARGELVVKRENQVKAHFWCSK